MFDSRALTCPSQYVQAVREGCAQMREAGASANVPHPKGCGQDHYLGPDTVAVLLRILDPIASGKIRTDTFVDFIFGSAQPPLTRSGKANSPNTTHGPGASLNSPDDGPSSGPLIKSRNVAPPDARAMGVIANLEANMLSPSLTEKTLDPWARKHHIHNVVVPVILPTYPLHDLLHDLLECATEIRAP